MLHNLPKNIVHACFITLCFCVFVVAQEPNVSSIEYELRRDESEDRILVTWKTNFPATGSTYRVVAKNQLDQETVIDQNVIPPTVVQIVPPGTTTITGTTITIKLPYGGASAINDTTKSLDVTVTPFASGGGSTITKMARVLSRVQMRLFSTITLTTVQALSPDVRTSQVSGAMT